MKNIESSRTELLPNSTISQNLHDLKQELQWNQLSYIRDKKFLIYIHKLESYLWDLYIWKNNQMQEKVSSILVDYFDKIKVDQNALDERLDFVKYISGFGLRIKNFTFADLSWLLSDSLFKDIKLLSNWDKFYKFLVKNNDIVFDDFIQLREKMELYELVGEKHFYTLYSLWFRNSIKERYSSKFLIEIAQNYENVDRMKDKPLAVMVINSGEWFRFAFSGIWKKSEPLLDWYKVLAFEATWEKNMLSLIHSISQKYWKINTLMFLMHGQSSWMMITDSNEDWHDEMLLDVTDYWDLLQINDSLQQNANIVFESCLTWSKWENIAKMLSNLYPTAQVYAPNQSTYIDGIHISYDKNNHITDVQFSNHDWDNISEIFVWEKNSIWELIYYHQMIRKSVDISKTHGNLFDYLPADKKKRAIEVFKYWWNKLTPLQLMKVIDDKVMSKQYYDVLKEI